MTFLDETEHCHICHGSHQAAVCPQVPECDHCLGHSGLMQSCLPQPQGGPCDLKREDTAVHH
ncbi:MAG: hypothetical protein HQL52_05370 [Magnetococcales bacterium]|nr:hypothetical protein [Magnetococcales bacterium]